MLESEDSVNTLNLNGHAVVVNCTGAFTAGVNGQWSFAGRFTRIQILCPWQFAFGASIVVY